jgi:hypothetical protein
MSCRSTSKGWHHCCWKWAKTAEGILQGCPEKSSALGNLECEKVAVFTVKFAFIRTFCNDTGMIIMQVINLFANEPVEKLAVIFVAQEFSCFRAPNAWSCIHKKKKTPWSESASELYRPSHRCLSAK